MRSQEHNKGELAELKVNIEKEVVSSLEVMASNSKLSIDELVCIAVKRFRASHSDYMGNTPELE